MEEAVSHKLIDTIVAEMQPLLEHFDEDHAEAFLLIIKSHLANKLSTILNSQQTMIESFLFQQKMILSLLDDI